MKDQLDFSLNTDIQIPSLRRVNELIADAKHGDHDAFQTLQNIAKMPAERPSEKYDAVLAASFAVHEITLYQRDQFGGAAA